jgi:hypothetical protein
MRRRILVLSVTLAAAALAAGVGLGARFTRARSQNRPHRLRP